MTFFGNDGSRLTFEHLEQKQLLAGDVVASVIEGNLIVEGDELGNQIAITAGQNPGQYIIRGLDGTRVHLANSPDSPTATNIEHSSGVVVNGVRHNVRIGMGGGDDLVAIYDAGFRGNVGIGMGGGNDTVRIGSRPVNLTSAAVVQWDEVADSVLDRPTVAIRGNLTIVTGEENDIVAIPHVHVVGRMDVRTGAGNDRVQLGVGMNAVTPADSLMAVDATLARPSVMVGRGTSVELGAGSDGFVARGVRSPHGVGVFGGDGRDEISMKQVQAGERLTVDSGPGEEADLIAMTRVEARTAAVESGGGNDVVQITDSAFGLLAVLLEEGDDKLTLRGVKSRATFLSGGDGEDTLTLLGENLLGNQIIREFEHRGTVA